MGIFKIEILKNNKNINSLEDWFEFAAPTKEDHWKDGRSAKELAKYILSGNGYLPQEIKDILLQIGCSQDKIFKGEPEKITSLKVGRGTGRHHDLLLEQEKEIVVGIEAKANDIQKALFLIITFKKEGSYNKEKLKSNIKDIDIFINSLAKNKANNAYKFEAYKDVELYIKHIEIDVK